MGVKGCFVSVKHPACLSIRSPLNIFRSWGWNVFFLLQLRGRRWDGVKGKTRCWNVFLPSLRAWDKDHWTISWIVFSELKTGDWILESGFLKCLVEHCSLDFKDGILPLEARFCLFWNHRKKSKLEKAALFSKGCGFVFFPLLKILHILDMLLNFSPDFEVSKSFLGFQNDILGSFGKSNFWYSPQFL